MWCYISPLNACFVPISDRLVVAILHDAHYQEHNSSTHRILMCLRCVLFNDVSGLYCEMRCWTRGRSLSGNPRHQQQQQRQMLHSPTKRRQVAPTLPKIARLFLLLLMLVPQKGECLYGQMYLSMIYAITKRCFGRAS